MNESMNCVSYLHCVKSIMFTASVHRCIYVQALKRYNHDLHYTFVCKFYGREHKPPITVTVETDLQAPASIQGTSTLTCQGASTPLCNSFDNSSSSVSQRRCRVRLVNIHDASHDMAVRESGMSVDCRFSVAVSRCVCMLSVAVSRCVCQLYSLCCCIQACLPTVGSLLLYPGVSADCRLSVAVSRCVCRL